MDSEQINALYQVGGAVAVVVVGAFFGIQWVLKTVTAIKPFDVKTEKTTIITADTVAMESLSKTVEASNVILTENNVLRREELADREALREAIEDNTKALEKNSQAVLYTREELRDIARLMSKTR